MTGQLEQDRTRTSNEAPEQLTVEDADAEIQRGNVKGPQFFGNMSNGSAHSMFSAATNLASAFGSIVDVLRENTVDERTDGPFRLTHKEYALLQRVAQSIASYGNIPQDTAEDFLLILCFIDNITDLQTIADGVQLPELADANLIRNPIAMLNVSTLYKVAFAASAVDGLIRMFRKYLSVAQNTDNQSNDGDDIGGILNTISSALSGFGGASARLENQGADDALGHFLSELITGKRIPMTVIAKNPSLQSPSYQGKAFFGEGPAALSNVDIGSLFCKKIAVFPKPSAGAGTSSFSLQNMGSLASSLPIDNVIGKMLFGNSNVEAGSKKSRQLETVMSTISDITGAVSGESVDVRRADTAIPLLSAFSAVASGTEKSIFSIDTFAQGWKLANSVSNQLQAIDPTYLQAIRRFT